MSDVVEQADLTPEEVLKLLSFVAHCTPIVVGGQSVNIWSELFQGRDAELDDLGTLTSKDLDFYQNQEAQKALVEQLEEGKLFIASFDDHGPSASVVTGKLGDREVQIDFLSSVSGVQEGPLKRNSITISYGDGGVSVTLMHPLDCIRSRLSNINRLHRKDRHSINQAIASVRILDLFIDSVLQAGDSEGHRMATDALGEMEYILRDMHIGQASDIEFDEVLDLRSVVTKYMDDDRLDQRFRDRQLAGIISRIEDRYKKHSRKSVLHAESSQGSSSSDDCNDQDDESCGFRVG